MTLSLHFESPISEWHVTVLGDRALGDVDVFRDIYMRLPNDGEHDTMSVLRTSLAATWAHWSQHATRGPLHLTGKLLYGNDEVYRAVPCRGDHRSRARGRVGRRMPLPSCEMQHEILERKRIFA